MPILIAELTSNPLEPFDGDYGIPPLYPGSNPLEFTGDVVPPWMPPPGPARIYEHETSWDLLQNAARDRSGMAQGSGQGYTPGGRRGSGASQSTETEVREFDFLGGYPIKSPLRDRVKYDRAAFDPLYWEPGYGWDPDIEFSPKEKLKIKEAMDSLIKEKHACIDKLIPGMHDCIEKYWRNNVMVLHAPDDWCKNQWGAAHRETGHLFLCEHALRGSKNELIAALLHEMSHFCGLNEAEAELLENLCCEEESQPFDEAEWLKLFETPGEWEQIWAWDFKNRLFFGKGFIIDKISGRMWDRAGNQVWPMGIPGRDQIPFRLWILKLYPIMTTSPADKTRTHK